MSETRVGVEPVSPELNTQHFTFNQNLPSPAIASSWRPEGAEGYAQISVPAPLLLTLNAAGDRVYFEQGVYIVPRFLHWQRKVWEPQSNTISLVEVTSAIAGDHDEPVPGVAIDARAMHPHLQSHGVKRSGAQPLEGQVLAPPTATVEAVPQEDPDERVRRLVRETLLEVLGDLRPAPKKPRTRRAA